ncbi:hypothetical protein FG386_001525 [Cryptosporidium ryanae]|uniref:uncharacterized protein n=1 Tax=Cryptosporidium ryanae TaxID=515981 RepID=UPI00351A23B0|nr:hypothetical protein FG386_001525 [Cryptosporidium ryanae]
MQINESSRMRRLSTLELLESLYNDLQENSGTGIKSSGDIIENSGIGILKNLHGSKDPFGVYKNEYLTHIKSNLKSNNPLSCVIRRLIEELFSIVTTVRYPILLTPNLYVIYISFLCELGIGKLPSIFLDTYEGSIENFDVNFLPLLLEVYIRRSPLWGLLKNITFCVDNIYLMSLIIVDNTKLNNEFKELQSIIKISDKDLKTFNFLPLFFANIDSLNKGYKSGRYLSFLVKDKNTKSIKSSNSVILSESSNNISFSLSSTINKMFGVQEKSVKKSSSGNNNTNGDLIGAICNKSPISRFGVKGIKSSEYNLEESNINFSILDNFSLCRLSISLIIKVFNSFNFSVKYDSKINDFNRLLLKLEKGIAIIISGSYINDINNNYVNIETNNTYEFDGTLTKDIFTLLNKVDEYKPFHYLHFQVISGLRVFINWFNIFCGEMNINRKNSEYSGLHESIVLYITRILTQIIKIIEFNIESSNNYIKSGFSNINLEGRMENLNEPKLKSIVNSVVSENPTIPESKNNEEVINSNTANKNHEHINEICTSKKSKVNDKINLVDKFNSYIEIIPSEIILLIQDLIKSQEFSKNVIKDLIFELHELQVKNMLNNSNFSISSLFIRTFVEYIKLKNKDKIGNDLIIDSWKYIIEYYVRPNILDSYTIYLFCEMVSDSNVINTLNNLDVNSFIYSYFGILIRIMVYHPDISYKAILSMILSCMNVLCKQLIGDPSIWFDNWLYSVLMIISMPLMTLFPQKIESNISEIQKLICHLKPNNRVLSLLLKLLYQGINTSNNINKINLKDELKSIICDLSVNILLKSIYNNNNNLCSKNSHSLSYFHYYSGKFQMELRTKTTENEILNKNFDFSKILSITGQKLHTITMIEKSLYILDIFVLRIINYMDNYKIILNIDEESFFEKLTCFLSEIFELFPYIFYQGGEYSLELQKRFSKLILNIFKRKPDILFVNRVFNKIISCLKIELYSNTLSISSLCWIIGQVILLKCGEQLLIINDKKTLVIIESLKLILEKCYLNCVSIFNNVLELFSDNNIYFDDIEYKNINQESYNNCNVNNNNNNNINISTNCYYIPNGGYYENYNELNEHYEDSLSDTYSSDSSFLSDSSFKIDQEILELNNVSTNLLNEDSKYVCEKNNKFNFEYRNSINIIEYNKYIEYMYLIDTSISLLLKIGIVNKHFATDIIKTLELFQKKLYRFYFKDEFLFSKSEKSCYFYEYIQTSNIIVIKKLNKSIKTLKFPSMFSSTLFNDGNDDYNAANFSNYPINGFTEKIY